MVSKIISGHKATVKADRVCIHTSRGSSRARVQIKFSLCFSVFTMDSNASQPSTSHATFAEVVKGISPVKQADWRHEYQAVSEENAMEIALRRSREESTKVVKTE